MNPSVRNFHNANRTADLTYAYGGVNGVAGQDCSCHGMGNLDLQNPTTLLAVVAAGVVGYMIGSSKKSRRPTGLARIF